MRFYQPRDTDIMWARNMMNVIVDGGTLAYPATRLIYRVEHNRKRLVLENPEQLVEQDSFETHLRTVDVFADIGYDVVLQSDA